MPKSYYDEVLADLPNAYWRLSETSGTTHIDSSGNGRSLTSSGSPTLGVTGALGDFNTCVGFDAASSQYLYRAWEAWMVGFGVNFAVECWFKTTYSGGAQELITRQASAGVAYPYRLAMTSAGVVSGLIYDTVSNPSIDSASGYNDGVWHHVVFGLDGTYLQLIIDGKSYSPVYNTTGAAANTSDLNIGRVQSAGRYFTGQIDEIAIYDYWITTTRVVAHYNARAHPGDLIVTIGGTTVVADKYSVLISEALDQLADTATVRIQGAVAEGSAIRITFGTSPTPDVLFGGRVITRKVEQERVVDPVWTTVECEQAGAELNRHLIHDSAQSYAANSLIARMIAAFATSVTTTKIAAAIASPVTVAYDGRPLGTACLELGRTVGAVFKVDDTPDAHLYVPPEAGYTQPATLTTSSPMWRAWSHERTVNELRSRVYVRGQRQGIATALVPGMKALAFGEDSIFGTLVTSSNYNHVTVECGPLVSSFGIGFTKAIDFSVNSTGLYPGDSFFAVQSPYTTAAPFWVSVSGQYLHVSSVHAPEPPWTAVYYLPNTMGAVSTIWNGQTVTYPAQIPLLVANSHNIPSGTPAAIFLQLTSNDARSLCASLVGGDGWIDYLVDDDTLDYAGCVARGEAELSKGGTVEETIGYVSEDYYTHAGRQIGVSSINSVTGVFTIQSVQVSFDGAHRKPQRQVVASSTRTMDLVTLIRCLSEKTGV